MNHRAIRHQRKTMASIIDEFLKCDTIEELRRLQDKHSRFYKNRRVTIAEFTLDEVYVFPEDKRVKKTNYVYNGVTYTVKTSSNRLKLFRNSRKCVKCGIEGTKFLLEQYTDQPLPHFNLYAEQDGELILMTQDHIVPLSKGGSKHFNNLQVMCCVCNERKADKHDPE